MTDENTGVWETPWHPPGPTQLPDLRGDLARQTQTSWELQATAGALRGGRGSIAPRAGSVEEAARLLLDQEHHRLGAAQLYFVSPEMTRLAVTAGETLPDFHLEPDDVPAPYGLIVFGEPIGSYINTDSGFPVRVPIVAVCWGQWNPGPWDRDAVWLTFYSPTDYTAMEHTLARDTGRELTETERRRIRQMRPALGWDNEMIMAYGDTTRRPHYTPGDSFDGDPDTMAPWGQTVRAAWLLMTQPNLAEVEHHPQPRATRRRAARDGFSDQPVQLVHLRRATRAGDAAEEQAASREWTCRWMVSGHWRQQWYPTREVHRPIWIAPHLKGPHDKPFKTSHTVHVWDR